MSERLETYRKLCEVADSAFAEWSRKVDDDSWNAFYEAEQEVDAAFQQLNAEERKTLIKEQAA